MNGSFAVHKKAENIHESHPKFHIYALNSEWEINVRKIQKQIASEVYHPKADQKSSPSFCLQLADL